MTIFILLTNIQSGQGVWGQFISAPPSISGISCSARSPKLEPPKGSFIPVSGEWCPLPAESSVGTFHEAAWLPHILEPRSRENQVENLDLEVIWHHPAVARDPPRFERRTHGPHLMMDECQDRIVRRAVWHPAGTQPSWDNTASHTPAFLQPTGPLHILLLLPATFLTFVPWLRPAHPSYLSRVSVSSGKPSRASSV